MSPSIRRIRGTNRFDLAPTAQYLAALAGPLNLVAGGADTLVFWDTANPSAENYTFDDIPSMLTLATVPAFATSWSGMAAVYLETNGLSIVNDPSSTVLVDVPPPSPPPAPPAGTAQPAGWAGLPAGPEVGRPVAAGPMTGPALWDINRPRLLQDLAALDSLFSFVADEPLPARQGIAPRQ
jgi:hypothetical protein